MNRTNLAYVQFSLGLVFVVTFVFFTLWARFPTLYRDDWDWTYSLLTQPISLRTLFEPHNEHLIPLPRLLFALQYRLEGSAGYLVFAIALCAQLTIGWLVWREALRRWRFDDTIRRSVFGASCGLLFSSYQLQSIVFVAAVLFPLVQLFAVLGIVCLLNASEPGAPRRAFMLSAAGLASAGAALTTTNGLVVPFILAVVAWARREPAAVVRSFALAGVVCFASYAALVGRLWLHAPPAAATVWAPPSVGGMIAYFLTFFGSGLAYGSLKAARIVGATAFGVGCYVLWRLRVERSTAFRIEHFAAGLILFGIASAAMMTPTRAQFGAIQAAQSRYATYALTYWAGLVLWGASRMAWRPWRRTQTRILQVAFGASCILLVVHLFIGFVWKAKADNIAVAALALAADVHDDEWVATLHPMTAVVYTTADRLRAMRDRNMTDRRLGTRVGAPEGLDRCNATLDLSSAAGRPGWRLTGTVAARASTGIVVDRGGIVRGLARPMPVVASPNPTEPDVTSTVWASLGHSRRSPSQWVGFGHQGDGQPYTFYAVDNRGKTVCQTVATVSIRPGPIRITLDAPVGDVTDRADGQGWAFQCGGTVKRLALLVDAVTQQVLIERHVSRPDVRAAFARECDVAADSGFSFTIGTRILPAGRHLVMVRAFDTLGRAYDSNPTLINVHPP